MKRRRQRRIQQVPQIAQVAMARLVLRVGVGLACGGWLTQVGKRVAKVADGRQQQAGAHPAEHHPPRE